MVASSIFVNNEVQVLPNPCALTIKPRLEYLLFLTESIIQKLRAARTIARESNGRFYLDNCDFVNDNQQFKKQVNMEATLVRALESVKIIRKTLGNISQIDNISQTVSPLVLVARTVNSDIYAGMPQISRDLIELSGLMGSIVMDSGSLAEAKFDFKQTNLESKRMLAEVNLIAESKIRTLYPNLNC